MVDKKQIETLIEKQKSSFLQDYKRIVESPSVSAQPKHKKDIEETAKIAAEFLKAAGAEVKVYQTKGNPVILGRMENQKGAPTVGIYNHLDVQPAEFGKDGWTREPFKFVEEKGRFWSRGATDDKGPAMTALWAAKMAREMKIPLNIEFIWELEEEIGSPNFASFLREAKNDIQSESIVVCDTIWLADGKPAITMGLRGILLFFLRLQTGQHDVHSGLCGGGARNPLTELCSIVASCVDAKTGKIKIPGVDKTWSKVSKDDLKDLTESGFSVAHFKKAHGLDKLRTEEIDDLISRIWCSPTFEVHGIVGGYQGAGAKTVIPPSAEAKLSMRLVPGQNSAKILELVKAYVQELNPDVEIEAEPGMEPFLLPKGDPILDLASQAVEFGFDTPPAFNREGGSIGAVVSMTDILEVPALLLGLSLPEDRYHGPDESFAWKQIEGGVKTFVKYFELLANKK